MHVGETLASAGDGGAILVWHKSLDCALELRTLDNHAEDNVEGVGAADRWNVRQVLRATDTEDIYDLDFSPDGQYLMVGLTDNSAQIWSLEKGLLVKVLKDHKHFVQGVCWDPLNRFVVSQSCDRSVKVWQIKNSRAHKPTFSPFNKFSRSGSLFQDESCVSFFRRLSFSIDGSLLFMPVGLQNGKPALHICPRNMLASHHGAPLFSLSCFDKPVIAVRCSPVLFEKCSEFEGGNGLLALPYRMLIAVLTLDRLFIFDTEHREPLWSVSGLHYGSLTDVSWSADGRLLVITSTDGFCSLVELEPEDLFSHPLSNQQDVMEELTSKLLGRVVVGSVEMSSEPDISVACCPPEVTINQVIPRKRSVLSEQL